MVGKSFPRVLEGIVKGIEPVNKWWTYRSFRMQRTVLREALGRFSKHIMERSVDVLVPHIKKTCRSHGTGKRLSPRAHCRREAGRRLGLRVVGLVLGGN